jgi:hypothetical protein
MSIIAYASPPWRVVTFDRATGEGTVRGVGTLPFAAPGADFEPGERVFVRLGNMQTVSHVVPAVAHWPVPADLPAGAYERQSDTPEWAPRATAVLEALPYPLEAELCREPTPSVISWSLDRNMYAPGGIDVSLVGELQLIGLDLVEGVFPAGRIAGRVASRLERASLSTKGVSGDSMALAFSCAGSFEGSPFGSCLCVVRDLRWGLHDHSQTSALDRAAVELWATHGAPSLVRHEASGAVHGRFGERELLIGTTDPAAARRWAFAWTRTLSRPADDDDDDD